MLRFLPALLVLLPNLHAEPFLVAHRGASADAPENTLPAFELAWEQKADAIEGDFRLTRDGHIVCLHDGTTKRTGDRNLPAATSTLADLQQVDVGTWKAPRWKDTRIPTLAQVLATLPAHGRLFLEVKCGPEIVPPLLAVLADSTLRPEQVTVICFNAEVIRAFKAAAPDRPACWLCKFERKADGDRPTHDTVFRTLAEIKADGLSTNPWPALDRGFLARLARADCSHHVWTVDDAPTARKFLDLGTATITTNRPGALRAELAP